MTAEIRLGSIDIGVGERRDLLQVGAEIVCDGNVIADDIYSLEQALHLLRRLYDGSCWRLELLDLDDIATENLKGE